MSTTQLTPAQHAILAKAINSSGGKIEWFPDNIKGGARTKVLAGMFNRALITPDGQDGKSWRVAAEGYDALGMPRPGSERRIGSFEVKLDEVIANAEAFQTTAPTVPEPLDAELEAAVSAAEAQWTKQKADSDKPATRSRKNSKQAEVIRMLQRPEGVTISQICAATGWQTHTVRGTFAGAFKKKLGLTLTSDKAQGGERVYRVA